MGEKSGFLEFLKQFEAYGDPVRKKSLFFVSIAASECQWSIADPENLLSPVDYHEIRGHLRIGTVRIVNPDLLSKLLQGLVYTEHEDTQLRMAIQEVDNSIARHCCTSNSVLHYLFWNVFRNCCPRDSASTHCARCRNCHLPSQYRTLPIYRGSCIFQSICASVGESDKFVEPPYAGHFY